MDELKSSAENLAETQGHLTRNIQTKGTGLAANHGLALRNLASDNAFSDITEMVGNAVSEDDDVVYGLFLSEDARPLGVLWPQP